MPINVSGGGEKSNMAELIVDMVTATTASADGREEDKIKQSKRRLAEGGSKAGQAMEMTIGGGEEYAYRIRPHLDPSPAHQPAPACQPAPAQPRRWWWWYVQGDMLWAIE